MRFLLDTNVISEVVHGDRRVLAKLGMHRGACAMAATTWFELHFGATVMRPGQRREQVDRFIRDLKESEFPILQYDAEAAIVHARAASFMARRKIELDHADGQIAAISVVHNLVLATRNVRHFEHFPDLRIDNWFD